MAKFIHDDCLDDLLDAIAAGSRVVVCSGQPANFAGIAAVALADIAVTPGAGNGDFTIGNGDVSGRKLTLAQQAGVDIDTTGTATHISIDDGAKLLAVTTCTSQGLTDTGTVTIPAFDVEVADPT